MNKTYVMMKSGAGYNIDASFEDVRYEWKCVFSDSSPSPIYTYNWLDSGTPNTRITIDLREVEHIREVRA